MASEGGPHPAPMRTFAATLPSMVQPRFSTADLMLTLNRLLEGTGVTAFLIPELTTVEEAVDGTRIWHRTQAPPRVGVRVNGVSIMIKGEDRPPLGTDDLARLDERSWPGAGAAIARARAHVAVGEVGALAGGSIDDAVDRATAVTVALSAVALLVETLGVVWLPAHSAVAAEDLPGLVTALGDGRTPANLWIGCARGFAAPGPGAGARTLGLEALIGAEIEVSAPHLTREPAFAMAIELARAILRAGELPAPGAMIDFGRDAVFAVQHTPEGGRLINLLLSPAGAARRRPSAGAA